MEDKCTLFAGKRMIHISILFVFLCFVANVSFAIGTVHVEIKAGKLESQLKNTPIIDTLIICGTMNGSDFKYLNKLQWLKKLDLENVHIIPGGKAYFENNEYILHESKKQNKKIKYSITRENELSAYMFYNLKSLNEIILPKKLQFVAANALTSVAMIKHIHFTGVTVPYIEKSYIYERSSIYVPSTLYKLYKEKFKKLNHKYIENLYKDNLPKKYNITLNSSIRLSEILEGAYIHVNDLTVKGNITMEDVSVLSKLSNLKILDLEDGVIKMELNKSLKIKKGLERIYATTKKLTFSGFMNEEDIRFLSEFKNIEMLNLSKVVIKDSVSSDHWRKIFEQLVEKDSILINLENRFKTIELQKNRLTAIRDSLINTKESREKGRDALEFLNAINNLGEEMLDEEYERGERTTRYYVSNKLFAAGLRNELQNELQKIKITSSEEYEALISKLKNEIILCDINLTTLREEMDPLEEDYYPLLEENMQNFSEGSIIPSYMFKDLKHLKEIILPLNTVAIGEHAFSGCNPELKIQMDESKIKIANNIW